MLPFWHISKERLLAPLHGIEQSQGLLEETSATMSNAQKRSQSNPEKYSKPWKKVELKDVFYASLFGLTLTLGIIFGIRTILIIQSKNPQQPTSSVSHSSHQNLSCSNTNEGII
jgi:hypothetical protein